MTKFKTTTLCITVALGVLSVLCITATVLLCIAGVSSKIYFDDKPKGAELSELSETYDYGEGYLKSIVWVGDRTISELCTLCPVISPSQLWSGESGSLRLDFNLSTTPIVISSDTRYASISDAAAERKPKYMLITVGIENGVGYCTEEKFKEYYQRLIDSVKEASPDTMIILQSVFPVSRSAEKDSPSISNDRIQKANIWIGSLCSEMSLRYLNTYSALVDDEGHLKSEYDSGDGITLNEAGYGKMLEYVRTHGYK